MFQCTKGYSGNNTMLRTGSYFKNSSNAQKVLFSGENIL